MSSHTGDAAAVQDEGISIAVENMHLPDGSIEQFGPSDVVVVVGPNSAGKSQLLRELFQSAANFRLLSPENLWVKGLEFDRAGDLEAFDRWFSDRARLFRPPGGAEPYLAIHQTQRGQLPIESARAAWRGPTFSNLQSHMIKYLAAGQVNQLNGRAARNPMESPVDPIHRLWDSHDEEQAFSDLVHSAFGFHISVNRHDRGTTGLFKGEPRPEFNTLPPTREALDWYAPLLPLDQEGDGVRAFVGIILELVAGRPLMSFVDEPETFLHPRHAKLIGRHLVERTKPDSQVFIATHSADVLQGILDARGGRPVKVLRLDGVGRTHHVLDPERIKAQWSNPLLRYARMLDGLFHRGVIVCEADNDCRFYEAHLDAHTTEGVDHDLVITHVNGKGGFRSALEDLRALGIHSAVIGDIDVLNDAKLLSELVTVAGGDYSEIEGKIKSIHSRVSDLAGAPIAKDFQEAAKPVMGLRPNAAIPEHDKRRIVQSLKNRSGWEQVKISGLRALRGGTAASEAREVLDYLRTLGIFLVPVGELESWYFELADKKGADYVVRVLEDGLYENPPAELREFISQIATEFSLD